MITGSRILTLTLLIVSYVFTGDWGDSMEKKKKTKVSKYHALFKKNKNCYTNATSNWNFLAVAFGLVLFVLSTLISLLWKFNCVDLTLCFVSRVESENLNLSRNYIVFYIQDNICIIKAIQIIFVLFNPLPQIFRQ